MQFLEDFRDNEAIKVITGIRRSGKTFLMNMFWIGCLGEPEGDV